MQYGEVVQGQAKRNLEEIEKDYPGLRLLSWNGDFAVYQGALAFTANYQGHGLIDDVFDVEIKFPVNGGRVVPTVKEVSGRISRKPEFHINPDGTMCLGAPFEVRRKYLQDRSLRTFINQQLIPFLYGCSIKLKYNYWPYEELAHGGQGIIEYYKKLFNVQTDLAVIELLKALSDGYLQNNAPCVCGSQKPLKKCHKPKIQKIKNQQTREEFFSDFIECIKVYVGSGKRLPPHIMGV